MIRKLKVNVHRSLILSFFIFSNFMMINANVIIDNLMVEYSKNPIGIDVTNPRFSWQMIAPGGERDYSQTACQIVVKDPGGAVMWDSKKVASDESVGVLYSGSPLKPTTKYSWSVMVWDQNGDTASGSSWFETGLMNPDPGLSAWDGAMWIGGNNENLVLYSHYLSVYNIRYTLAIEKGSTKASFILGTNDMRLIECLSCRLYTLGCKNRTVAKL